MGDAGARAVFCGFLILFVSGVFAMAIHRIDTLKQEAIDRGFAQYNSTTGKEAEE